MASESRESGLQKEKQSRPSKKTILVLKLRSSNQDNPEKKDKLFRFDKERIVIGSVISADVRLMGDGISPIHAVLEIDRDLRTFEYSTTVFDLASDTGIFVNGKKTVTHRLAKGDKITIGRHEMVFSLEEIDPAIQSKERVKKSGDRTLFVSPTEDLAPLLLEDEREVEEIFDFRPSSKRALEGVMSWFGSILAVEHFVNRKTVTLGTTRKSDFPMPPLLSASDYALVSQSVGGYFLNLHPKMKGVVQSKGSLRTLDEIRGSGHGGTVPLGDRDFAKISIGDLDFYLSFTAAPPRLKTRRILERDPFFLRIFLSSMALTAVLLVTLFQAKYQPVELDQEVPERIATILYEPEKFIKPTPKPTPAPRETAKPEPIPTKVVKEFPKPPAQKQVAKVVPKAAAPKPVHQTLQVGPSAKKAEANLKPVHSATKASTQNRSAPKAEAKEGEGARAKGVEGSRGEPDQAHSHKQVTEISRPSPHAGAKGATGATQVEDEGNVDLLKGASGRIQNILGNSAAKFGEGSQNLKGFGNFSSRGAGGLAFAGSGKGGGGNAETTLGGLGNKGSGMGRVGTGKGAAGSGVGIVGQDVRVAIRSEGPEETIVMGAIDRDAIAAAIYAHRDEFRLCYEREINAETPNISGQIGTSFVIGASGRVTQAGVESSSLNNANTERCVLAVLRRIQFPQPQGGGVVEVHYPFKFSSAGK